MQTFGEMQALYFRGWIGQTAGVSRPCALRQTPTSVDGGAKRFKKEPALVFCKIKYLRSSRLIYLFERVLWLLRDDQTSTYATHEDASDNDRDSEAVDG